MSKNNTVTVNGAEYNVRYSIRALFLWEEITGRNFELKTLLDNYLFYFCVLISSNENCDLMWDQFIDEIDKDPMLVTQIQALLGRTIKLEELFPEIEEPTGEKKN